MLHETWQHLEKYGRLDTQSSLGLGIQAFQVWFSFRLTRFLYGTLDHGKTVSNWNNPMIQKLLSMSLKQVYQFLLVLRSYSKLMNQELDLPSVDVV